MLLSCSFGGKVHSVSLYKDVNTELATAQRDVEHRILLERREDRLMQSFREDFIYPQVSNAWKQATDKEAWRSYLERTYAANRHISDEELQSLLKEVQAEQQDSQARRLTAVAHNRRNNTENQPGGVLPRQFTTNMCVRYKIGPGIFTSDVRRAISKV